MKILFFLIFAPQTVCSGIPRVIADFSFFPNFLDFQENSQYFLKGFCFASIFFMVWDKCCFCHDLSVILCQNLSFVQKIVKIQHFAVNYGRIVVIDFRNAKTLPLRKCFTRLCGYFVYFQVSEVEMLWKVVFKYRFLRIQTMSFIQIVHLSCKCDFSKTHVQYDVIILFQPGSFRYTL